MRKVHVIGGSLDGQRIERPAGSKFYVPFLTSTPGFSRAEYVLRRFRDAGDNLIELAIHSGEGVDPTFLADNGLRAEH